MQRKLIDRIINYFTCLYGMRFWMYAYFRYSRYSYVMYAYFEKFYHINPEDYWISPFIDSCGTCKTLIIPGSYGIGDPRPKSVRNALKLAGWKQ